MGRGRARSGEVKGLLVRPDKVRRSGEVVRGRGSSGEIECGQARSGKVGQGQVRSGEVRRGQERSVEDMQGHATSCGEIGDPSVADPNVAIFCTNWALIPPRPSRNLKQQDIQFLMTQII